MKKKLLIKRVKWLVLLVGMIGLFFQPQAVQSNETSDSIKAVAMKEPVVMVPGNGADTSRFDQLIQLLKVTTPDITVVKIKVKQDATIQVEGLIDPHSQHPIFVIGFEDNKIKELTKQSRWLQVALQFIQTEYGVKTYHFLGHSSGGLLIMEYLATMVQATDPKLDRLITLGTPFNDRLAVYPEMTATASKRTISPQMAHFLHYREQMPTSFQILNIIGKKAPSDSDGKVFVNSALAGRLIFANNKHYQELVITQDAQHSALVQNKTVQKTLENFFWEHK